MDIILGSSSPFRAKILQDAGIKIKIMAPDIDEKSVGDRDGDPQALVIAIAKAKAAALIPLIKEPSLLITSDQVVLTTMGDVLEKPDDAESARRMLKSYANRPPSTLTAVVVTDTKDGTQAVGVDFALVYFREIPADAIERAIARGTIMQCCGGFDVLDPDLAPYVEHIEGDATSEQGMPMELLQRLAGELGYIL